MKKHLTAACSFWVACVFLLSILLSCTVDDRYSLSAEIDTTIGIGKGLTFPLGSTKANYISDLLNVAENDFVTVDDVTGNVTISSKGTLASESFKVDEMSINIKDIEDTRHYDFNALLLDDISDRFVGEWPYLIHDAIDVRADFEITEDGLPKEVTRLTKLIFKEPVKLSLFVEISSEQEKSQKLLEKTGKLYLKGEDKDYFELHLPEYLVFDKNAKFENGVLMFDGEALYNQEKKALYFEDFFYVDSIDFTKTEKGYYEIKDGKIDLHETIKADGIVVSDDYVLFDVDNIKNIDGVEIATRLQVGEVKVTTVEGRFEPEIAPVSEVVDLNLSDMEFLENAYIDMNDPRLKLTFDNGLDASIWADASIVGYDRNGDEISDTRMDLDFNLQPAATTRILIDRYGAQEPGWTNVVAGNLNELIKNIPDKIGVELSAGLDNSKDTRITLGEDMDFSASYELQLPLIFDDLRIEYTYSIEDVFGGNTEGDEEYNDGSGYYNVSSRYYDSGIYEEDCDNGEYEESEGGDFSDIVKEIRGASLSFKVLNTIPIGLKPEITIYDEAGNELPEGVRISIEGEIKRGNAVGADGVIGTPVESAVKVSFAAQTGLLDNLYRIDIKLVGTGQGAINANEYIQLTDIALTIDDYIVLDLND